MSSEDFTDIFENTTIDFKQFDKKNPQQNYKKSSSYKNNVSVPKYSLHNDVGVILEDKIANNQITLTKFELKTIKNFIDENKNFHLKKSNQQRQEKAPRKCYIGVNCITWMCAFEHPPNRKSECSCKDDNCNKLHITDALCKDPFHPDNCKMAHKMSDFIDKSL